MSDVIKAHQLTTDLVREYARHARRVSDGVPNLEWWSRSNAMHRAVTEVGRKFGDSDEFGDYVKEATTAFPDPQMRDNLQRLVQDRTAFPIPDFSPLNESLRDWAHKEPKEVREVSKCEAKTFVDFWEREVPLDREPARTTKYNWLFRQRAEPKQSAPEPPRPEQRAPDMDKDLDNYRGPELGF